MLSETKPNQNQTMLHLSRSLLPIVQLPARFVPHRPLARTDGPRRGPLQGPLQRPMEGLGGRRAGGRAQRALGNPGRPGGSPGRPRGARRGSGAAREARGGGPGWPGPPGEDPGRPRPAWGDPAGRPGRVRAGPGKPGGGLGAQGARRAKPRALRAVRRSACIFAWPARTTPTTRVQLVPELVGRATQLVQLKN